MVDKFDSKPESLGKDARISSMVVIIGHEDQKRIRDARKSLRDMQFSNTTQVLTSQPNFVSRKLRIGEQSKIAGVKAMLEFRRMNGSLRALKSLVASSVEIFREGDSAEKKRRHYSERCLSDKHIRAWQLFLESDSAFLVVVEDDIVSVESEHDQKPWMEDFFSSDPSVAKFVNLSEAFELRLLGLRSERVSQESALLRVSPPSCNTTAAYAVNRVAVERMLEYLLWNSSLRELPADWLLNRLLLETDSAAFFLEFPMFRNGSLFGVVESSVQ